MPNLAHIDAAKNAFLFNFARTSLPYCDSNMPQLTDRQRRALFAAAALIIYEEQEMMNEAMFMLAHRRLTRRRRARRQLIEQIERDNKAAQLTNARSTVRTSRRMRRRAQSTPTPLPAGECRTSLSPTDTAQTPSPTNRTAPTSEASLGFRPTTNQRQSLS